MQPDMTRSALIERHTIFPIPSDQRHGTALGQWTLWFGVNLHLLTIVTGSLATLVLHLPLVVAIGAIVVGNLVGAVFMALHAAQGPRLGVPQMVQSRGQFGAHGAVLIIALVMVMYIGFIASNFVLGAQSLRTVLPRLSIDGGIVGIALGSVVVGVVGYDLVMKSEKLTALISGLAMAWLFGQLVIGHGLPPQAWHPGGGSVGGFLAMVAIGALWQIAYAPYVSDYTRYLPDDRHGAGAFWACYWGCALGSILPMVLGAMLGLVVGAEGIVGGLTHLAGRAGGIVILAFTIGMVCASAINLYGCALSAITVGQTFVPQWRPGGLVRAGLTVLLATFAAALGIWGADTFLLVYEHFLALLLCVMAPWTAINLADYYIVRKGHYDVAAFFAPDGGVYGRYNAPAMVCLIGGVLIQVPFVKTRIYTGWLVASLDGVDISWALGLTLPALAYVMLVRGRNRRAAQGR